MDVLHGILAAYEMRTKKKKSSKIEETFKASNKKKNKEHESSDSFDNELYAEETHFVRKIKKVSRKYKGKFPFKCFDSGKVGHFVAKCPYVKNESSNNEEDYNVKSKHHQQKK